MAPFDFASLRAGKSFNLFKDNPPEPPPGLP